MTPGIETVTLAGRNGGEDPVRAAEEALDGGAHPSSVVRRYAEDARAQGRLPELDSVLGDFDQLAGRIELHEWLLRNEPERANGAAGLENRLTDAAGLLDDPESLQVPDPVIPGVSFPQTTTCYSGKPKHGGKTHLLTAGCYAVASGGRFLGEWATPGTALWIMAEGSEVHLGRYLAQVEAELPEGRFTILQAGHDPLGELERAAELLEPDCIVIDSLGSWLAPLDVDLNTEEVVPPLRRLERVARSGPAVTTIHHGRKEDGDPAGSHKIKAMHDIVRTVEVGEHARERVIKGVGRWSLPDMRYRMEVTGEHPDVPDLETVRFRVVDPDRELEEKILDFLEVEPGAGKGAIREAVSGARQDIDTALAALEEDGVIDVDRSGVTHQHRIRQNPHRQGAAKDRQGNSHGSTGREDETLADGPPPSVLTEGGTPPGPSDPVGSDEDDGEEVSL